MARLRRRSALRSSPSSDDACCGDHRRVSCVLRFTLFADGNHSPTSDKVEPFRPLEILCQILRFVAKPDGVKALLPSSHVNINWWRAALSDPSLWTTIYTKQTPPPLLDMVLARSGDQLLTARADHPDLKRHAELWVLANRFEELHYSASIEHLVPFLASLGPAPTSKSFTFDRRWVCKR